MSVPVLVTSIYNRPDLLDRMLDSIDVPVERGLIVDNGYTGYSRRPSEAWHIFRPPYASLGWPGTINFGIMQMPDAPWWLFVNNDAYFEPGVLERLAARMEAATGPLCVTQGFTVGALNRALVDEVGLFDEWSFWPLYFDDQDFAYRCRLAGHPVEIADLCREGDDGVTSSATIRSDPALAHANNRTWQINREAYIAKWGGPPGRETYTSPWDSGLPLWATRPAIAGREARRW